MRAFCAYKELKELGRYEERFGFKIKKNQKSTKQASVCKKESLSVSFGEGSTALYTVLLIMTSSSGIIWIQKFKN